MPFIDLDRHNGDTEKREKEEEEEKKMKSWDEDVTRFCCCSTDDIFIHDCVYFFLFLCTFVRVTFSTQQDLWRRETLYFDSLYSTSSFTCIVN